MELQEPKSKRVQPHIKLGQPLPILSENETGTPVTRDLWPVFTGQYNGDCIVISLRQEMEALYTMGFFGKGSLSRGFPAFDKKTREWKKQKQLSESQRKVDSSIDNSRDSQSEANNEADCRSEINNANASPTERIGKGSPREALDLEDDNSDKKGLVLTQMEIEPDQSNIEKLNLSLEEAFFLSYALGCLKVMDLNESYLSVEEMLELFQNSQPGFVQFYVAYHYFRAKGWVVKSGIKFGGHFLLYKHGPTFYHASYIVLVEALDSRNNKFAHQQTSLTNTWTSMMGINRLAETATKEVLICQVIWPSAIPVDESITPEALKKFKVNEVLIRRWIPSHKRDELAFCQD